jgi:glyoxylase-like metal-dependent hydrolase (beta-lactamase superfamily II)
MYKANRILVTFGFVLLLAAAMGGFAELFAQQDQNFDNIQVHVLPVQGNVYMLVGAGGNVTAQIGNEGVLLVDTQFAPMSDKILAAVRQLTNKPIRYIINTHVHPDHIGGNEKLAKAGERLSSGENFLGEGAAVLSHGLTYNRMNGQAPGEATLPVTLWPTDPFFTPKKEIFFNGEAIELIHQPAAHTDGDLIVFFRRSDVVSAGDIFVTTTYPVIDLQRGGTINGLLDSLNRILDIAIPADKQEGGTQIIPGHGRLSDEADVFEFRNMLTIIRDRIQDMVQKGMTLQQIMAAKPTEDYDPRYGVTTGPWTTDMFIEAVYRSLRQNP